MVSDEVDNTDSNPQAKPKRRPSQSLLVKPKVGTYPYLYVIKKNIF